MRNPNSFFSSSPHPIFSKTTLVSQIKKTVEERGGYLIHGKFDVADGSRPDSVLFQALDSFFGAFAAANDDDAKKTRIRQRIIATVGVGIE